MRAQRPTSATAGNTALVLADGTIEGFVGGDCAEHSVRAYALKAIESGEPLLLRILPFGDNRDGEEVAREPGAVTVENPCLSGGAIEIFLEPVVRAPRVYVEGDLPIVARAAAHRRGARARHARRRRAASSSRGRATSRWWSRATGARSCRRCGAGSRRACPTSGWWRAASAATACSASCAATGWPGELLDRIDTPAGLDLGARTPAEIALSILARIVEVRRARARAAPTTAVDPICGMTVVVMPDTPSVEHDGETVYFCREGCKAEFELQHA